MSRLRTGLQRDDWVDEGPSHAFASSLGLSGSKVIGRSGSAFLSRGPASAETRAKASAAAIARYARLREVAE